ncbi:MAG: class I SAM-dependent methyltransferase [Terracidiphilus sp.]|jgi:ubiquinone/menaquinone biosynthesis C-methylase UbiE
MTDQLESSRSLKIQAWIIALLFVLGFFFHFIGLWTGPILGVWFVSTQRPLQGFLLLVAINFFPSLAIGWSNSAPTALFPALAYAGWILLTTILIVVPFSFHKWVSPRLPGFAATLPLPLAAGALLPLLLPLLPIHIDSHFDSSQVLVFWFAAVIVWMWQHEFPAEKMALAAGAFFTVHFTAVLVMLLVSISTGNHPQGLPIPESLAWLLLLAAAGLAIWASILSVKQRSWTDRPQTFAFLQSPNTGEPLQLVCEKNQEELLSPSGERFSIHNGIPVFIKSQELTGANLKYNNMYELFGGLYDDFQRIVLALRGLNRDAWFRSYMDLLEVQPGDSVLETSVGTGLNFKYIPKDPEFSGPTLSGIDLSSEMLLNCQANLHRWNLDANLFLANAESLPFADSSFDVVFHVGGINFFNDPANAILEMIRVAKPGSLLLIADETEKLSQNTYENILGRFLKKHREPVVPPIHLVPEEMEEVQLQDLRGGEFYAITFRKPPEA